jgi:hypothetical protein
MAALAPSSNSTQAPIAVCCLVIIAALVLGVGLPGHMLIRHLVQTLPLWAGVIYGFRRSRATGWLALPLFVFWLALMTLIWLYLLGLSKLMSGHFSPLEIAMTITVGAASIAGIISFAPFRKSLPAPTAAAFIVALLAIQFVCLRISFLPSIAHR